MKMKSSNPLKEWLDSVGSDVTKKLYQQRFQLFLAYHNPTLRNPKLSDEQRQELERSVAKDLLDLRREQIKDPDTEGDMSKLLKQFYIDLTKGLVPRVGRITKGKQTGRGKAEAKFKYKLKAAEAYVNAVRQFFRYFGKAYEVEVRITEQQLKPKVTKKKYEFSTEELQRILNIATIRDKTLILLGATAGWGAGDIVILKKATIENTLNTQDGKYYYFTKRVKTNSDMYLCLSSEARQALATYLKTLPQDEEWLFPGYNKNEDAAGHIRPNRPDYIIKDLCEKAGIKSRNPELQPIRFHCLRQYFSRKYRGHPECKEFCMGHTPRYEGAYSVTETEIWEDFKTQDENLRIQATTNNEIKTKLETQDIVIKRQQKEIEELKPRLQYLEGLLEHLDIEKLEKKGKIEKWPYSKPKQEIEESEKKEEET